jgi:hypothetical protein
MDARGSPGNHSNRSCDLVLAHAAFRLSGTLAEGRREGRIEGEGRRTELVIHIDDMTDHIRGKGHCLAL